ncbi:MAG: heavy metal translocating P-type ATPase [Acidiferrobacteraceae bacterium]|nr:heavy metal translocating P-type ATPase [Acidiferrobacteraceae bacterium]
MAEAGAAKDCKLCGLPAAATQFQFEEHLFCCFGCREVYRRFGDHDLFEDRKRKTETRVKEPEGEVAYLRVEGMHCSSCEVLIDRLALQRDGIVAADSSYATSTVRIIYDPGLIGESEIQQALSRFGYQAHLRSEDLPEYDERLPFLNLVVAESLAVTVMMLYLAFYYPIHLGLVDPEVLEPISWFAYDAVPVAIFILTTVVVFYSGVPIFRGAIVGLRAGLLNMDNLLSIAILAAYGYSTNMLMEGSLELYFDVVVMIIAVVTVGRFFEREAKSRATAKLLELMERWVPVAKVQTAGGLVETAVDELVPGDRIVISRGESVPIDGKISRGEAAVDESLMTGEPFPKVRSEGDRLLGGSLVVEGELEIEVGNTVESQMDNLARILWNSQSGATGAQGMADRVARLFVPIVLVLAIVVTALFIHSGAGLGPALLAGMATLIVSCPCTFGLAIPLTTAAGVSQALERGVIFTSADIFERTSQVDIIAIDKTGTLSTGVMRVTRVVGDPRVTGFAAAAERHSSHPVAEAISRLDLEKTATDVDLHPGRGVIASVEGHRVAVGSTTLFAALEWKIPEDLKALTSNPDEEGVVSFVGWDGRVEGAILTQDQPRPGWEEIVSRFRRWGRVTLLTGAERPGIYKSKVDDVFAGIPPEGKGAVIQHLKREGSVVMIGDGSNDAPALAEADLGIAFGAPTALAADAADMVIPGHRLEQVFTALKLIQNMRGRIRQNLGWALLYNITAIPLAVFGVLNPLFAALAMSASSLLVVWNSSRSFAEDDADG